MVLQHRLQRYSHLALIFSIIFSLRRPFHFFDNHQLIRLFLIMGDVLSLLVFALSRGCCQEFCFLFLYPSTIFMTYPSTICRSYGAGGASIGLRLNPLYLKPSLLLYLYNPFHVLHDTLLLPLSSRSIFFCRHVMGDVV